MYIVFGTSTKNKILASSMMPKTCNSCGYVGNWNFYKSRSYFTLFFILKIFPVGKASYFYGCPNCKRGINVFTNEFNSIMSELQMTPDLNKEINSDVFRQYMASIQMNSTNMQQVQNSVPVMPQQNMNYNQNSIPMNNGNVQMDSSMQNVNNYPNQNGQNGNMMQ